MYNKWTGIGNLCKDPEMRFTVEGKAVTRFTIACNNYKKADGTWDVTFMPVSAWGKLAEICGEYLKKGKQILVEGQIKITRREVDGVDKWFTECEADTMKMLGTKPQGEQ